MIISTCGFGDTGASAVSDFLIECKEMEVFDYIEFTIASMPDGLEDLEFHLMHKVSRLSSSIYAIQRFHKAVLDHAREWHVRTGVPYKEIYRITDEFIDSITQLSFVGFSPMIDKKHNEFLRHYLGESIILHRIIPKLEKKKIIKKNFDFYPLSEVKASIKPDNFYDASQKYVRDLLSAMGCDLSKKIIMDQAFSANDPAKSFKFFDDPYAIIVDRDPRDIYISAREYALSVCRFFPTDTVENFIQYYKMVRDDQPYKDENPRVLRINFEQMVYDYDNTANKIEEFIGVKNNSRKTIFVPEMSAANTKLWKKFPGYEKDMKLIETELAEYIFPFDKYKAIEARGESFTAKSPLNKHYTSEKGC